MIKEKLNMKIYPSKSSFSVKLITIGVILCMGILIFTLFTFNDRNGIMSGIAISVIIFGLLIYFYGNSLNEIIVDERKLILKKPFGKIEIPLSEIIKIERLEYSNLSMTYGSKGVFGYMGNTMDDSISLVKDRKNMIRIITSEKKYTISANRPTELISNLKEVAQHII